MTNSKGILVIYVPGNHDFWWDRDEDRYTIYDQLECGRERAVAFGIYLLLDNAMVIGGTHFIGGTLWTDFPLGSYGRTHAFRAAQGSAGIVDYRRIRTGPRSRNRIESGEVLAMHRATRAFIEGELARPHYGQTVVVTHHAPHSASLLDPHADLAWCYASDLTDLIMDRGPDLCVHRHVHQAADYVVGCTRVICNLLGHVDEWPDFVPDLMLD